MVLLVLVHLGDGLVGVTRKEHSRGRRQGLAYSLDRKCKVRGGVGVSFANEEKLTRNTRADTPPNGHVTVL